MVENRHKRELTPAQKTMYIPLMARALESEKKEPAIRDDMAVQIAMKLEPEIRLLINNFPELSRLAWISRSICLDKIISDFLTRYPGATVVNIGCGLDTTYDRLKNRSVMWYDLDFPEVIAFRRKFISESLRRKYIEASFLAPEWFDFIKYEGNILFVAAGVFYYYKEESIKRFVLRLCNLYPRFEIVFDATSRYGVSAANRLLQKSGINKSPSLKWGLNGVKVLLSWSPRIIFLGKYRCFKGNAIKMKWKQKILGYISDLLNIQYILHLRIRPDYKNLVVKSDRPKSQNPAERK